MWEMLIFDDDTQQIWHFQPAKPGECTPVKTYLKSRGFLQIYTTNAVYQALPYILQDGWEIVTIEHSNYYFRRPYKG
jgi:hypothetical protein